MINLKLIFATLPKFFFVRNGVPAFGRASLPQPGGCPVFDAASCWPCVR